MERNKMEPGEIGKVLETDVLVLGAGAAGCGAALAARDAGAKCIIVDKGSLEACGQVGPGNANWHTHLGTAEWDTAEEYTKFWAGEPTSNLSASLFHKGISLRMPLMLKRIQEIGIKFHKNADGSYRVTAGLGQPYPWTTTMINSKYFKRLVGKEVRRVGAEVSDHVMITGLLKAKDTDRVAGATGFNIQTREFLIFRAKAVVICMSTSNERFSNSSTNNSFNTWLYPFNTGSGPIIAYDAGAKITTLEKASATILSMGFGAPGMAAFTGMGAYMINASDDRYMFRYDKRGENAPRHVFLMAAYTEIAEGRGPL
ncbi:FAD-binding protein, partial [Chloroflexota bacterium]